MKVFLDAGHGGGDSGAVNGARYEKNDVLALTLKIDEKLKSRGIDVKLARSNDTFVELYNRTNDANNWGANLYLSIHRNSASASANGVETWIVSNALNDTVEFATKLNDDIAKYFKKNRGVKKGYIGNPSADFHINRETNMLSALLEIGFISSGEDNNSFDTHIEDIANSITSSVCSYFNIVGGVVGAPPTDIGTGVETPENDSVGAITIKAGSWNLRKEPNNNGIVVGVLSGGTILEYNGITGDGWYSIANRGFVHRNATTKGQPSNGNLGVVEVKNGSWNLRSEPSNNGPVVEVLKGGTMIEYNGITGDGWYSIANRGFIHKNCLIV